LFFSTISSFGKFLSGYKISANLTKQATYVEFRLFRIVQFVVGCAFMVFDLNHHIAN
jgi:hypothetical protein